MKYLVALLVGSTLIVALATWSLDVRTTSGTIMACTQRLGQSRADCSREIRAGTICPNGERQDDNPIFLTSPCRDQSTPWVARLVAAFFGTAALIMLCLWVSCRSVLRLVRRKG